MKKETTMPVVATLDAESTVPTQANNCNNHQSVDQCTANVTNEDLDNPLSHLPEDFWRKAMAHVLKAQRVLHKGKRCSFDDATIDKLRNTLCGVFYRLYYGVRWKDIPSEYGNYTTIYSHFRHWYKFGVIDKIDRLITKYEKAYKDECIREAIANERVYEPTDYTIAYEAASSVGFILNREVSKLPPKFDLLTDSEQLEICTILEFEISQLTRVLKLLGNRDFSLESVTQFLSKEEQRFLRHPGWPRARYIIDFNEAQYIVSGIFKSVNRSLKEIADVYCGLTGDERLEVCSLLENELHVLRTLLNEIKEVEQMNTSMKMS